VPQGIDCGADCTASYLGGVFVTLTALAEASSIFAGWEPARCGSSFALTADSTCTAAFTKKSYDVMAIAGAGGSITPSARIVNHGDTTTFAVAPDQGYTANASGCGGSLAGTTYTTGAIVEACTVRATFVANDTDSDGDGLPDWYEVAHGFDPHDPSDAALDADGDGLSNREEYRAGSDPLEHPYGSSLQQMYVAYYGRPGDPGGVNYWAGRMAEVGGNWIPDLVNAFGTSTEYTERFGALEPAALIDNLYRQLYNRDADPLGRAFYIDLLNGTNATGFNPELRRSTLAQIALDIANGTIGEDVLTLDNKLDVASDFTRQLLITRHPYQAPDIPLLGRLLATVTGDRQSFDAALEHVDRFMAGIADGTWPIGDGVAPGTYANLHDGGCAWARLTDLSGDPTAVIVRQVWDEAAAALVTLVAGDGGFQSDGCGTWIEDALALIGAPTDPRGSGIYRVGRDMAPGTWRADNPAGTCTWTRLAGFSGEPVDTIASGARLVPGAVQVGIEETDAGFGSEGCGTWRWQSNL
jgi:hypothetical protein